MLRIRDMNLWILSILIARTIFVPIKRLKRFLSIISMCCIGKCPYAILSWRNNWDDLTVFFQFPLEIRKIIYTTNLIENLNGKIRKYTKSKLSFPSDDAAKKTVYLSLMEIEKKWTQPIHNWGLIMNQFIIIFENRIQI